MCPDFIDGLHTLDCPRRASCDDRTLPVLHTASDAHVTLERISPAALSSSLEATIGGRKSSSSSIPEGVTVRGGRSEATWHVVSSDILAKWPWCNGVDKGVCFEGLLMAETDGLMVCSREVRSGINFSCWRRLTGVPSLCKIPFKEVSMLDANSVEWKYAKSATACSTSG